MGRMGSYMGIRCRSYGDVDRATDVPSSSPPAGRYVLAVMRLGLPAALREQGAVRKMCGTARTDVGREVCVIAAFFARVLRMCLGRPCTGFLLILVRRWLILDSRVVIRGRELS